MSCLTCIRWARRQRPRNAPPSWRSLFGFCRWPGLGPKPYWHEAHPTGDLMVHETHGEGCLAYKARKLR